jgi:hypothetical protein
MRLYLFIPVFLFLFASSALSADPCAGPAPIWDRFSVIPLEDGERCTAACDLFAGFGAREVVVEPLARGEGCPGNVIVTVPGKIPNTIIICAHLDRARVGEGALDDFSGVTMLAALFSCFRERSNRHTLLFVAFDGEEEGQLGSRRFIEASPRMPARVTAVVNLECLGMAPPRSWAEGSSDRLEEIFTAIGKRRGYDLSPVSIPGVSADSQVFLNAGYPAITVEGIPRTGLFILDTDGDRRSVVSTDILEESFKILVDFIRALDAQ